MGRTPVVATPKFGRPLPWRMRLTCTSVNSRKRNRLLGRDLSQEAVVDYTQQYRDVPPQQRCQPLRQSVKSFYQRSGFLT